MKLFSHYSNSNTTLVKVKSKIKSQITIIFKYSNTTLVKVKYIKSVKNFVHGWIQIQHLLKLNRYKDEIVFISLLFKYNTC